MSKRASKSKTARLGARIPVHICDQTRRAARLRGMTLTAYLIAIAGADARRDIEQAATMRLARADQIRFAEALANPAMPNEQLARAAKRHAELVERS